jgi:enamine deaminase RidA (YjgF/YER057c/UK114 family)
VRCRIPNWKEIPLLVNIGHAASGKGDPQASSLRERRTFMGVMRRSKASEFVFIAGQLSADKDGKIICVDDFEAQCGQVFANIDTVLRSVSAGWGNIVQFTTYLVHSQDIPKFMKFRLWEFPRMFADGAYPPNTLLMVDRQVNEAFLVEVQTVAAL